MSYICKNYIYILLKQKLNEVYLYFKHKSVKTVQDMKLSHVQEPTEEALNLKGICVRTKCGKSRRHPVDDKKAKN